MTCIDFSNARVSFVLPELAEAGCRETSRDAAWPSGLPYLRPSVCALRLPLREANAPTKILSAGLTIRF
jgi:hypothetical protein